MTDSTPDQTAVSDAIARREEVLRVRYAILGAVMAFLWIGHKGEPAWVHALRLLLVLATIAPLLMLTRRYYGRRAASKQQHPRAALYWLIGIRVATVTIALGLGWLVGDLFAPHHNDPARLIALRLGLLAVTIPMQIRLERRRQAMGIVRPLTVRSPRIIAAKFVLVLVALGAEWLIGMWTPNADLIVAAGLFGTVAWFGPKLNRYFFNVRAKRKGALAAYQDATLFKVMYGWGGLRGPRPRSWMWWTGAGTRRRRSSAGTACSTSATARPSGGSRLGGGTSPR